MTATAAGDATPVVAVIQARMGSERLPGKVLTDICGEPLLGWLLTRIAPSRLVDEVVVATTTDTEDDAIEAFCRERGTNVFRGHPTDVLARLVAAAREREARTVVRISADSPLIDHTVVDVVVGRYRAGGAELVQNHRVPGWPPGTAVEAMSIGCLERLHDAADTDAYREHVTLHAYDHADRYEIVFAPPPSELGDGGPVLYVDTMADLERIREICSRFAPRRDFGLDEVVREFGSKRR